MLLVRALYYSTSATGRAGDIAEVLEVSRRNNPALAITGVLIHDRGKFLQVLEGARPAVSGLLSRIAADRRHYAMTIAEFVEISERRYSDFAMAFTDADSAFHAVRLTDFDAAPAEALHRQIDAYLQAEAA